MSCAGNRTCLSLPRAKKTILEADASMTPRNRLSFRTGSKGFHPSGC
jgi:hypothetical protein